jgi:hypothetical protein
MSRELSCTEDPTADANEYCNTRVTSQTFYVRPEAAACRGCHDDDATAAHTELQTTASGQESCSVCHGAGKEFDVLKVHAE